MIITIGSTFYDDTYRALLDMPEGAVVMRQNELDRPFREWWKNCHGDWRICYSRTFRDMDSMAQHGPYAAYLLEGPQ